MEILSFLTIFIFVGSVIYLVIDNDDSDFWRERLERISTDKKKEVKVNRIEEVKQFAMLMLRPLLTNMAGKKKDQKTIKNLLIEAGYSSDDDEILKFYAQRIFYACAATLISLLALLLLKFDLNVLLIAVSLPIFFYIAPVFALKAKGKKRAEEIQYNLPDALDLLTVCVEAGLGLDAALARVAKEYARTSQVLSGELDRVSKDILAGIPRQEAFRNLSLRNNVQDLQSLAALLIQTDKLGTSISQSLRVYCDTVRTRRRQRVETLAQKASVKMIIPLVFFVLPAMFVVILAPAALSLMANMK